MVGFNLSNRWTGGNLPKAVQQKQPSLGSKSRFERTRIVWPSASGLTFAVQGWSCLEELGMSNPRELPEVPVVDEEYDQEALFIKLRLQTTPQVGRRIAALMMALIDEIEREEKSKLVKRLDVARERGE